jgi:hypothetical protein
MSIEQTDTIDFLNIDKTGDVLLTISDHLDWEGDEESHLLLLQEKLNAYLRFIESGEMLRRYPEAKERSIVIQILSKFPMSKKAEIFFKKACNAIHEAGFQLRFEIFSQNQTNIDIHD